MLKDSTRLIDTVARSAGSGVRGSCCRRSTSNGAFLLAEKILSRLRGSMLGSPQGITASVGVAEFPAMRLSRPSLSGLPIEPCRRRRRWDVTGQ